MSDGSGPYNWAMEKLRSAKRPPVDPARIEVVGWEVAKLLPKMTGLQKMDLMDQIYLDVRGLIEQSVRVQNPGFNEDEVRAAVNRRMTSDST